MKKDKVMNLEVNFDNFIKSLNEESLTVSPIITENRISFSRKKLIEKLGNEKILNDILKESKFTEVELFESGLLDYIMGKVKNITGDKLGSVISGGAEIGAKTILSNMIQPIITKLNITSQSFLWYFLTYGMTEVITTLGKDILNMEQPQFCETFTNGAVKGVYAYFAGMGYARVSQMLGFSSYNDIATSVMINISDNISKETVRKWVYGAVCGGKNGNGIYDIVKKNMNLSDLTTIF